MMTRALAMAVVLVSLAFSAADALEPQIEPNGIRWVSGGVGAEERAEIEALQDQYTLKAVFAAKQETAFAADVSFAIKSDSGVLAEGMTSGPWLLVALPPGTYQIEATSKGQTQTQTAKIDGSKRTQIAFYW